MTDQPTKPWYKRGWIILLAVVVVLFLIVKLATSSKDSANQNTNTATTTNTTTTNTTNTAPTNTNTPQAQASVVFDLETLTGKNIDQIKTVLGQPKDGSLSEPNADQVALGTTQWDNTFEKDGYELLVTFNPDTRSVIDFFLATNDPSGMTKDIQSLKQMLNVESTSNYTVEPVKTIKDPTSYTGVKATPKR